MDNPVLSSSDSGITTIAINRPAVKNSLNRATIASLVHAFKSAQNDKDCRVIIFRGAEDSAFCAGADLGELHQAESDQERSDFFNGLATLIEQMHAVPQPIIAMIHGYALAGGCGLAAAADIALASEDASFGLPELHIGLLPMVVMPVMHRAIGRRALSDMVLTADRIDAARALEIGLVTRVLPKDQLQSATEALAKRIAALAPLATAEAKKMLYRVGEVDYLDCLRESPAKIAAFSSGPEAREGIAAFVEKRKPRW